MKDTPGFLEMTKSLSQPEDILFNALLALWQCREAQLRKDREGARRWADEWDFHAALLARHVKLQGNLPNICDVVARFLDASSG